MSARGHARGHLSARRVDDLTANVLWAAAGALLLVIALPAVAALLGQLHYMGLRRPAATG